MGEDRTEGEGDGGPPMAQPQGSTAPEDAPDLLDVVRNSLLLYVKNWGDFFFPYLAVGLAANVVSYLLFGPSGEVSGSGILGAVAATIGLRVALPSLLIGGAALLALERHRGHAMSLREALLRGLGRFPGILAATLLLALLMLALLVPALVVFTLGDLYDAFILVVVGGAIDVYLFGALNLYAPVIMVEGLGPVASLRRSWELSRGRRKGLFGVYFAFLLLALVLFIVFNIPVDLAGQNPIVAVLLGAARTAVLAPWFAIAGALAYDFVTSPVSPAVEPRASGTDAPA